MSDLAPGSVRAYAPTTIEAAAASRGLVRGADGWCRPERPTAPVVWPLGDAWVAESPDDACCSDEFATELAALLALSPAPSPPLLLGVVEEAAATGAGLRWWGDRWWDAQDRWVAWPSALRPGQWCSPGPTYHPTETEAVSAALREVRS